MMMAYLRLTLLCFTLTRVLSQECEVFVGEPWPMPFVLVPRGSTVQINCADRSGDKFWSVDLGSDGSDIQYRAGDKQLGENDVYVLPSINFESEEDSLIRNRRLLINDTAKNNGTQILCGSEQSTTLFVFDPTPFTLKIVERSEKSVNISWSQDSRPAAVSNATQSFSLTVTNGTGTHVISLNDSAFYYFTAPEDAPSCEVYNFSVTATYVGATYTGAGCSVPSPVLSTLLPASLPDISELESFVTYSITKQSNKGITLSVSFQWQQISLNLVPGVFFAGGLPENSQLTFNIAVSNGISEVVSYGTNFYTTDVQQVMAARTSTSESTSSTTITIQCLFINGSNAQGCRVHLVINDTEEKTVDMKREGSCAETTLTLEKSGPLVVTNVVGYDVESDGSVGVTPVKGEMVTGEDFTSLCLRKVPDSNTPSTLQILIVSVTVSVVLLTIIMLAVVVITVCISKKLKSNIQMMANEVFTDNENKAAPNDEYEVIPDNVIKITPNLVYGVSNDGIQTTPNLVYGISSESDGIETTPNECISEVHL